MTQNAEVFRTPASHTKNKNKINYAWWNNRKHNETVSGGHRTLLKLLLRLSPYLTIRLRSLPPASAAGLGLHEHSLPAIPVILKPKETTFCAGEIKIELNILLLVLNGYSLQRSLSFKREVTLLYQGIHGQQNAIDSHPYSSIVSRSSRPPLPSSTTALHDCLTSPKEFATWGAFCFMRNIQSTMSFWLIIQWLITHTLSALNSAQQSASHSSIFPNSEVGQLSVTRCIRSIFLCAFLICFDCVLWALTRKW